MPQRDFEELLFDVGGNVVSTGAANAYAVQSAQSVEGYYNGLWLRIKANHMNNGASTLSINDKPTAPIVKGANTALAGGEITINLFFEVVYDEAISAFKLQNVVENALTLGGLGLSASGNRWGVIPFVHTDGVMEVGRYIDFHNSDADAGDSAVRLDTGGGTASLFINNTHQIAVLDAQQEWTVQQNFDGATLTDAANISWDLNTQQVAQVTLGGNRTLSNPTNQKDGATYILEIIQDGTGGRTLAYDTRYQFPGGTVPVLSTGANAVDVLCCVSNGTHMRCNLAKNFLAQVPTGAFLQAANATGSAVQHTFATQNIGAAHADRIIVCAIAANTTPVTLSSATIGGIAATIDIQNDDATEFAAVISAPVPSGTTATVVLNFANAALDVSIGLYRFVGLNSQTPTATASNDDDPTASTINVSANGFIVGVASFDADTTAITTVGVTENYDADIGSSRAVGGIFSNGGTAEAGRTVSFDGGITNAAGVWAAYR